MHNLTKVGRNRIWRELEDAKGSTACAEYDMFVVASERAKYQQSLGMSSNEGNQVTWITNNVSVSEDKVLPGKKVLNALKQSLI